MIDKTLFFMETTLRICSSLDIEKALWKCLLYLKDVMPVNKMGLHVYDYELGLLDTIAGATFTEGKALSGRIHLSQALRKAVQDNWINGIHYFDYLVENETTKLVIDGLDLTQLIKNENIRIDFEGLNITNVSGIIMDLMLEDEEQGVLSVINDSGKPFADEHLQLIELLNKPFAVALTNALRYKELKQMKDLLADDNQYLQDELRSIVGEELVGAEMGLKAVMNLIHQVADLDSPVLLLGETGTGKEIIANTIHNLSGRRKGPFIKINCGAIPDSLIDSELFGHEKGAFTGAISMQRGRFERAHNGTIFLDEIGELPLNAQIRLLRVLQEKELERVGGAHPITVDIRVIAATHKDLDAMIEDEKFREDLYFRLKVFPIVIPPLRARKSDIPVLVQHFIQKKSREIKLPFIPTLALHSMDRILSYQWPGNVRELENAVERALIMSQGEPLTFAEIETNKSPGGTTVKASMDNENLNLDNVMARHIEEVLEMCQGKVEGSGGAAERLGIHPNTLRHRMKKLGVAFGRRLPLK